ncbi:hypothetical protein [Agromyces sp. NPDC058110]|uniref:hypothetical protein n=1 Tax=Agromyces sp. NPDC058110 TaxID=3346345 RepID=UPI0036D81749
MIGLAGVIAMCGLGATAGVHAAGGDDASPAVLLAKVLGSDQEPEGLGTDASGVRPIDEGPEGQGADGAPPEVAPTDAPAPTATPAPPADTAPPVDPAPAPDGDAPDQALDPSDPLSPEYNPYTTVGDPAYVTDDQKATWLGREAVVRTCMADAGFEYLDWQWWLGGSPQPADLSTDAAAAWTAALRGTPETDDGCQAQALRAAEEAEAAGTPLRADLPAPPGPEVPTERENWLAFQAAVRSCMADQGLEYRYWEYWNPAYDASGGSPAMPPGLTGDALTAWNLAAFGDTSNTNAGGGCWASGLQTSGYRTFD